MLPLARPNSVGIRKLQAVSAVFLDAWGSDRISSVGRGWRRGETDWGSWRRGWGSGWAETEDITFNYGTSNAFIDGLDIFYHSRGYLSDLWRIVRRGRRCLGKTTVPKVAQANLSKDNTEENGLKQDNNSNFITTVKIADIPIKNTKFKHEPTIGYA